MAQLKSTNIFGTLKVHALTQSTSIDTGALTISGGVGIKKNLNVGGSATILGAVTGLTFNGLTISNSSSTLSLGGNLTTSSHNITLTTTDNTSIELPTSGILATTENTEILTNKTISTGSTWSGNIIAISKGGTGLASTTARYALLGRPSSAGAPTWRAITVADISDIASVSTGITKVGTISEGVWEGTAIANDKLANSSITVGTTNISLGETKKTLDGLTSVTSDSFVGALTGNASTATKLKTTRAIALTGAVTGTADFDGSENISITTTHTADPVITLTGDVSGSGTMTNLGSVSITATVADDSHNHVIGNIDGLGTALGLKAPLASPTLTGTPVAPTATKGTKTTQIATTAFVSSAISDLVDSSPEALDTLNELAAALGDDPNFATTVAEEIGTKANKTIKISAGSGLTGGGTLEASRTISHADTSSQSSLTALTGASVISDIDLDTYGHVTLLTTRTLTLANLGYTGSATANDYSHPTGDGNLHVPATSTTNSGKVLTAGATAGALTWNTLPTIGNATLTIAANTGISLSATPEFTANATANKTITITNSAPNVTTNITTTHNATTVTVNSSDGTNGTINGATTTKAGVMTSTDKIKLDSHTHGDITNDGKIGTTPDLVVMTGTGGLISAKTAGTTSQYLRGDGSWGIPPDNNTTYSVGDGGLTEKNFTSILKTKLDGIATGATVNVSTNLSTTYNATTVVVNSSDGTGATINGATTTKAGVMTSTDKIKLDSHTHGNITNDGKVGDTADLVVVTGTSGAVTTASRSGIDSRTSFPPSSHTHDDKYYTESEMDTKLAGKSDVHSHPYASSSHDHDDKYYTESEMDTKLAGKSDVHSHPYASSSHTHNYAGSSSAGGAANSTKAAVTFNDGGTGTGADSGTTFNGSTARIISYNTIGAAPSSHTHAATDITSGTLAVSCGGTGASSVTTKYALLGPLAENGAPTWRAITSADVSDATNANTDNMIVKRDDSGDFIAGTITAALSGNASTASKWATARKISLTGSVTGSVSIDGSGDVSIKTSTNHSHSYLPLSGGTLTGNLDGTTAKFSGDLRAARVYNAVWNDIADFLEVDEDIDIEYGKAYFRDNNGKVRKTNKRNSYSIGIASDTFGFGVGRKDENIKQIPIAIGGWVLACVDNIYKAGTPLIATKDGTLTKASLPTKSFYPERIIAVFDRVEKEETWNGVEVKGRHWVKVK